MVEKEKRAATEAVVATLAHVAQLKLHDIRQTVMSQVQNFWSGILYIARGGNGH